MLAMRSFSRSAVPCLWSFSVPLQCEKRWKHSQRTKSSRARAKSSHAAVPASSVEGIEDGTGSSSVAMPDALIPTEEDYRALVLDLMLYRKETVQPVLDALRQERIALDRQIKDFDAKVRELSNVRDEIRHMLEVSQAKDAEATQEFLRMFLQSGTTQEEATPLETADNEESMGLWNLNCYRTEESVNLITYFSFMRLLFIIYILLFFSTTEIEKNIVAGCALLFSTSVEPLYSGVVELHYGSPLKYAHMSKRLGRHSLSDAVLKHQYARWTAVDRTPQAVFRASERLRLSNALPGPATVGLRSMPSMPETPSTRQGAVPRETHPCGSPSRAVLAKSSGAAIPSVREIHEVIGRVVAKGKWEQAIQLLSGALELGRCVPLTQTYELVLSATVQGGGCKAAVEMIDRLCTTSVSMAPFYDLCGQIWLRLQQGAGGSSDGVLSSSPCRAGSVSTGMDDLAYLMAEGLKRHVLLSATLRVEVFRGLLQNGKPEVVLDLYKLRERSCSRAGIDEAHQPSLVLSDAEMRLVMQAAGTAWNPSTIQQSTVSPPDIVLASFGTAFFKYFTLHQEEIKKHPALWLKGMQWLKHFPRSDVAVSLLHKMKDTLKTESNSAYSCLMDHSHDVEQFGSEGFAKLLEWAQQNAPPVYSLGFASALAEAAATLTLEGGIFCEEEVRLALETCYRKARRGDNYLPVTAALLVISLAFPTAAPQLWETYPDLWWWKELRNADGCTYYSWAYISDVFFAAAASESAPDRHVGSAFHVIHDRILLAAVWMKKIHLVNSAAGDGSLPSSVAEKQADILQWVSGLLKISSDEKPQSIPAIASLLVKLLSGIAPNGGTDGKSMAAPDLIERHQMALMGIELFFKAVPFRFSPARIVQLLCDEASATVHSIAVWELALAYYLQLERRCEVLPETAHLMERAIIQGAVADVGVTFSRMMHAWNGTVGPYRTVALPLLIQQKRYSEALEILKQHFVNLDNSEDAQKIRQMLLECQLGLADERLGDALLNQNSAEVERVLIDISEGYEKLDARIATEIQERAVNAFLNRLSTESAVVHLFNARKMDAVEHFLRIFSPAIDVLHRSGTLFSSFWSCTLLYLRVGDACRRGVEIKTVLTSALAPFQGISPSTSSFDVRYLLFALASLVKHHAYEDAYSFLRQVMTVKRRFEDNALIKPVSRLEEGTLLSVVDSRWIFPTPADIAVLRESSCLFQAVSQVLQTVPQRLAGLNEKKLVVLADDGEAEAHSTIATHHSTAVSHELCRITAFFLSLLREPRDIESFSCLLWSWRRMALSDVEHPSWVTALGEGAVRLSLFLLARCEANGLRIPLTLVAAATQKAFLKASDWELVARAMKNVVPLQNPSTQDKEMLLTITEDIAKNLSVVHKPLASIEGIRSLNPFHTVLSSKVVQLLLGMVRQVDQKRRSEIEGYGKLIQSLPAAKLLQREGSPTESTLGLRDTIIKLLDNGCTREAAMLLFEGLKRRKDQRPVSNLASLIDESLVQSFDDYFDSNLIARVLQSVSKAYPWRATVRCWITVRELLPYYQLERSAAIEAFTSLLLAMESQHASVMHIIQVVHLGVTDLGLPADGPFSHVITSSLAAQKNLSAAERLRCKSLLDALRDYHNEARIMEVMRVMCGGKAAPSTIQWSNKESSRLWMPKRPALDARDTLELSAIAPLILFSTTHQLEVLSKKHFDGRWLFFELKPLLFSHQKELRLQISRWNLRPPSSTSNSAEDVIVDELCKRRTLLVRLSDSYKHWVTKDGSVSENSPSDHELQVKQWLHRVVREIFHGLIPFSSVMLLWSKCRKDILDLSRFRWERAVELELMEEVWSNCGKPPPSLLLAPQLSSKDIAHYWSVYRTVLIPELNFEGPELCCLAYYVPDVLTIHKAFSGDLKSYRSALWELAAAIQTAHFDAHTIPAEECGQLFRVPRSIRAIHAVLVLGRKALVSLHNKLEMDARSTRYLFRLYGGQRHSHSFIPANPAADVVRSLYAPQRSCPSPFRIPSRVSLMCAAVTSRTPVSEGVLTPLLSRIAWEAVLRDGMESPSSGLSCTPPDIPSVSAKARPAAQLTQVLCGTEGGTESLESIVAGQRDTVLQLIKDETTLLEEKKVIDELDRVQDPVLALLGVMHISFACRKEEVPSELSIALSEHCKLLMFHSTSRKRLFHSRFLSDTFFTQEEDQHYSQTCFNDVLHVWRAFSLAKVWPHVARMPRRVLQRLYMPHLDDVKRLPTKKPSCRSPVFPRDGSFSLICTFFFFTATTLIDLGALDKVLFPSLFMSLASYALVLLLSLLICATESIAWPFSLKSVQNEPAQLRHVDPPAPNPSASSTLAPLLSWREGREERAKKLWLELQAKSHFSACWKDAVGMLASRCQDRQDDGKAYHDSVRTRLAFGLAKCDAEGDGRSPFMFHCPAGSDTRNCIQGLSDTAYTILVQYRLHADVLCAYLQEELFQQRTEAAVASLHEETKETVEAMLKLHEMEQQVLGTAEKGVKLQERAQESVNKLQTEMREIEQRQKQAFISAQASVKEVLGTSRETQHVLSSLREELQEGTGAALESIQELRRQSVLQHQHVEEFTQQLMEDFTRLEAVQGALLSGAAASSQWIGLLVGCVAVVFITSFSRTAAARFPSLLLWLGCAIAPSGLAQLPHGSLLAHAIPWLPLGGAGVVGCILLSVFWTTPPRQQILFLSPHDQVHRAMLREELRESLHESQQGLIELLERSVSNSSFHSASPSSSAPSPRSSSEASPPARRQAGVYLLRVGTLKVVRERCDDGGLALGPQVVIRELHALVQAPIHIIRDEIYYGLYFLIDKWSKCITDFVSDDFTGAELEAEVSMWAEVCQASVLQLLSSVVENVEEPRGRNHILDEYYSEQLRLLNSFFPLPVQAMREDAHCSTAGASAARNDVLAPLEKKVCSFENQISAGQETIEALNQEIDKKNASLKEVKQAVDALACELVEKGRLKASQEDELAQLNNRIQSIQESLPQKEAQLRDLESSLELKAMQLASRTAELEEKEKMLVCVNETIKEDGLKAQLDLTNEITARKQQELEQIQGMIAVREAALLSTNAELEQRRSMIPQLDEKIAELESQLHSNHAMLAQQSQQLEEQKSAAHALEDRLHSLTNECGDKAKRLGELEMAINKMLCDISQKNSSLLILSTEMEGKEEHLRHIEEQILMEEGRSKTLVAERAQLEKEKRDMLDECSEIGKRKERITVECRQLEVQKEKLALDIAALSEEIQKHEGRARSLEQTIADQESLFLSRSNRGGAAPYAPHQGSLHRSEVQSGSHEGSNGRSNRYGDAYPVRPGDTPLQPAAAGQPPEYARESPPPALPLDGATMSGDAGHGCGPYTAVPENHIPVAPVQPSYRRIIPEVPVNPVTATLIAVQEQAAQLRGASLNGMIYTPRAAATANPAAVAPGTPSIARELYRQYVPRSAKARSSSRSAGRADAMVPFHSSGSAAEKLKQELRQIRRLATMQQASLSAQQQAAEAYGGAAAS
eukprot:gene10664-7409_t